MEDSQTQQPVDSSHQVTSKTPATWPKQKNSKRVAAGKAIAEKTKQARESQKKALAEAQIITANNQLKQAAPPVFEPPPADTPAAVDRESTKNVLTTSQWLSVISIFVSLAGIYYKREEIKTLSTKKNPLVNTVPRAPPPSLVDTVPLAPTLAPKRKVGISSMD